MSASSSVAPPPAKEALVIIFDVGKSLGTRSRDEFEKAKRAITLLIKMKVSNLIIGNSLSLNSSSRSISIYHSNETDEI